MAIQLEQFGLNPYCIGWYSLGEIISIFEHKITSLNPYCIGWYSLGAGSG